MEEVEERSHQSHQSERSARTERASRRRRLEEDAPESYTPNIVLETQLESGANQQMDIMTPGGGVNLETIQHIRQGNLYTPIGTSTSSAF